MGGEKHKVVYDGLYLDVAPWDANWHIGEDGWDLEHKEGCC